MQTNLSLIINNIIEAHFSGSLYKNIYLYNELFISISLWDDFIIYWISLKSDKLIINKYFWENTNIWKLLQVILKKYEKIFLFFLKKKKEWLFILWNESEFINIFDEEKLRYADVKEKLVFNFLDDYSYRRRSDMSFRMEEKSILNIYHSDFECSKCSWPKESFTNFVDYHNKDVYVEDVFWKDDNIKDTYLNTNITDYESITIGWNEKIKEILSDKKLVNEHDMIALNKTCISVIMWDDIESAFKINNIPKEKIYYTDQNIDSWYKTVINYLKCINVERSSKKNNEILFFWLNKNKNAFEVISFLEKNFDIKVWNILLPNINKNDLERIFDYNLVVFFTWKETKAQGLFKLYPVPQIESSTPFGVTKIRELTENILVKLWKTSSVQDLFSILSRKKMENRLLYEKVGFFRLWFIIHESHVKQFINDNFRWMPILSFLRDMWFQLSFFIYHNNTEDSPDLDDFRKEGFHIIISNKKEDLDNFIKSDINCFYSEIANDKRILDSNKEQFSVWDFEYGIDWFYRSFERLIRKCEKQVYKSLKLSYYLK